ncbi:MAG: hypothetical protein H6841_05340 [Planctomycetes bacterium]|nr:hypothetical protein [Planctomycetota bacterium]MCB9935038.1 hypothetical protein [Planctomycetota bacterium]
MKAWLASVLLLLITAPLCAQGRVPLPRRELPVPLPRAKAVKVPSKQQPSLWRSADSQTLFEAASKQRPILLLFRDDAETGFADDAEMRELAAESALFVLIVKGAVERKTESNRIVPPECKFLSANPADAYNIGEGECVVICDWFGNEFYRMRPDVKHDKLKLMIGKVPELVQSQEEKLQKKLRKGQECLRVGDFSGCLKSISRVYGAGVWGYEATLAAERLYSKLKFTVRKQVRQLRDAADVATLERLLSTFEKTEQADYIRAAIDRARQIERSPECEEEF